MWSRAVRALRGRRVHPCFVEIDSSLAEALVGERRIWVPCSFNGLFWGSYLLSVRVFVGSVHDRGRCGGSGGGGGGGGGGSGGVCVIPRPLSRCMRPYAPPPEQRRRAFRA